MVAHGTAVTVAWRAGHDVLGLDVDVATGRVRQTAQRLTSVGGWPFGLVPLGDDVVIVGTAADAALLSSGHAAPFPWAPNCSVAASALGPASSALVMSNTNSKMTARFRMVSCASFRLCPGSQTICWSRCVSE